MLWVNQLYVLFVTNYRPTCQKKAKIHKKKVGERSIFDEKKNQRTKKCKKYSSDTYVVICVVKKKHKK